MNVYFSSDNHYFHANIIKYCNRPYASVDEMNTAMVSNWNSVVGDNDVVFHLGDLSAGLKGRENDLSSLIGSLKGTKILIRGNHDHQSDDWYVNAGFSSVHDSLNLGGALLIHYPLHEAFSRGFTPDKLGTVEQVVHGHVHRCDIDEFENHYNVAVDRNNFTPIAAKNAIKSHVLLSNFMSAQEVFLSCK